MENTALQEKIYHIRDLKVMFDRDLAFLYGVETKRLKEAVRRNLNRFPSDFMFELNKEELANWRTQFASSNLKMGLRHAPMAFTEHGILMLSSVLGSDRAVEANIQIMRVFVKARTFALETNILRSHLEQLQIQVDHQGKDIEQVFAYLENLLSSKEQLDSRTRIGYKK